MLFFLFFFEPRLGQKSVKNLVSLLGNGVSRKIDWLRFFSFWFFGMGTSFCKIVPILISKLHFTLHFIFKLWIWQNISNACKLLQHDVKGDKLHHNINATAERHWLHCVYCISPMRNCFRNGKDFGLFTMFTTFYFFIYFNFKIIYSLIVVKEEAILISHSH